MGATHSHLPPRIAGALSVERTPEADVYTLVLVARIEVPRVPAQPSASESRRSYLRACYAHRDREALETVPALSAGGAR
jgi:hypothetical protein